MKRQSKYDLEQQLLYKYTHVGCPAARYEDNCEHPSKCAENGRCLDLKPWPKTSTPEIDPRPAELSPPGDK
jgi:hypothetical protein